MIVGSGLLARAFRTYESRLQNACVYAAGVSNSSCTDEQELERDKLRLRTALAGLDSSILLVYLSTCSVRDPWSKNTRYVAHKIALEGMVRERARHLIVRLPQLAGKTPNPHTLLNYLFSRIVRSERIDLWKNSERNIIDVADAVQIIVDLMEHENLEAETIDVASPRNYSAQEIIAALEITTGRPAICNVLDKGGSYHIDTARIAESVHRCGISFDDQYLMRTLVKYYG